MFRKEGFVEGLSKDLKITVCNTTINELLVCNSLNIKNLRNITYVQYHLLHISSPPIFRDKDVNSHSVVTG